MIIKVSGIPRLQINGSNFSADVPITAYDNAGWAATSTVVTVTGALSDSAATFMTSLQTQADTWKATLATMDTMNIKLVNLVGRTL